MLWLRALVAVALAGCLFAGDPADSAGRNRIEFEQALDYHVGTLTRAEAVGIWGPPTETREALSPVVAFWREPDRRGALESPFGGLVRPLEMPDFELVLEFDDESSVLVDWELVLASEAPRRWQIYWR